MSSPIHIAIMGATGYGAGELLRLLVQHPDAQVVSLTSASKPGASVDALHPHLRGFYELSATESIDLGRLLDAEHAVVFSALPHGAAGKAIDPLLNDAPQHLKIIDLSGDFRLQDKSEHEQWYPKSPWLADHRDGFVYGMPELHRERIRAAHCIANPGCLATNSV